LNPIAMGYAVGIAQRWNLRDRLAFVVSSTEDILRQVQASYPGHVSKVLIQFPTPYRRRGSSKGQFTITEIGRRRIHGDTGTVATNSCRFNEGPK